MATLLSDEDACHLAHLQANPDRAAAAIAALQLSVITTAQLALAGLGRRAVAGRVARGQATRILRGVYLWGGPPAPPGAVELAACLACGPSAVVSHGSAAWLWDLAPPVTPVEISLATRHCRSRSGVRIHRVRVLEAPDVSDVGGIPVTSPARTMLDVAADAEDDALDRMLSDVFARQLATERELRACLRRNRGRAGSVALSRLLDAGPAITRARSERILLRIVRDARLPRPKTNVKVEGKRVDAWWPEHNLVVEIDGFAVHGHRRAFEADRATDQRLVAAGYRVMRITWRQLVEQPLLVAANLAAALARGP